MEVFVTPGSAALDKFGLVSRAIEGFEVVIIHAFLILVVYHKIIATQGIILGALGALFRGPGRRRRIIMPRNDMLRHTLHAACLEYVLVYAHSVPRQIPVKCPNLSFKWLQRVLVHDRWRPSRPLS